MFTGEELPPKAAGRAAVWRRRQKGTGHHMVSCPLLTPLTFLCAATPFGRAAKRGLRGLGSVRRADFGTLSGPEVSLRGLPRITVRGQTVQGDGVLLRKAPLPSSVLPWSTKRHCGPLAFRRATEGSRVQRRVWGRQEGAREPYGALAPFCLRRETPAPPRRRAAAIPLRRGYGVPFSAGRPRQSPCRRAAALPPPWVRRPPLRRETPAIPRRAVRKGTVSTGCSVVRSLPPGFSQHPRIFREFTQAVCVF